MSSWGPKLEKKLKALADSASKESMQTLANWVWFNRKNGSAFAKTFCDALVATTTETRQWLYWQVLNESLLANRDDVEKWERASELRATLGEAAVVPALESLGRRAFTEKIEGLWKLWNDSDVFGGPTIIGQIRRLLTSPHLSVEEVEEVVIVQPPAAAPVESPPAVIQNLTKENHVDNEVTVVDLLAETTTVEPTRRSSMSSIDSGKQRRGSLSSLPGAEIEYDFESKNVPLGVVDSREFLDPCKAVATLQIARDVRNDTPVQLNSLLSNLPKDIMATVHSIENGETKIEDLDKETIAEFSTRIPAELLEVDLDEQYQTIKTFQDIIRQQQTSREKLIFLLLKSRCQFGSQEAAKQYMELQETSRLLKKRKQQLMDALQLEGLDAELDTTDFEKSLEDLPPLAWYQENGNEQPEKRQRVD